VARSTQCHRLADHCPGRGTKLSEKLMSDDKVYEGTIKFGETTNSYDADGELVASCQCRR